MGGRDKGVRRLFHFPLSLFVSLSLPDAGKADVESGVLTTRQLGLPCLLGLELGASW